jgi:hypothetical protein
MFALLKNALSVESSASIPHHRPVLRLDLTHLFTSSQTRCKFRRPDHTDAELLEMSPPLRHHYLTRHDPVARLKRIEAQRPINAKLKQRRKDDPKYQQQETARWRAAHQARRSNEGSRTRDLFGAWLEGIPERQRKAYDWKTHVPVVFPEGQRMTCSVCSESRYKAKLWWERLNSHSAPETSDAKQWTCHSCYMEREMTDVLPRGFEGHVIGTRKRWPLP